MRRKRFWPDTLIKSFLFGWGSSAGFVAGAILMAFALKFLGGWPPSDQYLRGFALKEENDG